MNKIVISLCIGTGLVASSAFADNLAESDVVASVQQSNNSTTNLQYQDSDASESASLMPNNQHSTAGDYHRFFVNAGFGGVGYSDSNGNGGPAVSLNLGYNFNRIFAIEAGYTGSSSAVALNPFGAIVATPVLTSNVYDVAFRSTYHISDFFSIYGKVGAGLNNASWSQSSDAETHSALPGNVSALGALFGEGISVDLWHVSLFAELDQFSSITGGSVSTPTSYTGGLMGIQFNF